MTESIIRTSDVPLKKATRISVDCLRLDQKNPRLVGSGELKNDAAIISELYRGEYLGELLQSFAANGYLDIKPLIVELSGEYLVVLEGNRRLAAIKLFCEQSLARQVYEIGRLKANLP